MHRLSYLHICVRPLVARSTNRAMSEPQKAERAIVKTLTLFFHNMLDCESANNDSLKQSYQ